MIQIDIYLFTIINIYHRKKSAFLHAIKNLLLLLPHNIRMQYNCIHNVTWFITVNMCKFIYLIDLNVVTARLLIILIQIIITFFKSKWYILEWHGSYSTLLRGIKKIHMCSMYIIYSMLQNVVWNTTTLKRSVRGDINEFTHM